MTPETWMAITGWALSTLIGIWCRKQDGEISELKAGLKSTQERFGAFQTRAAEIFLTKAEQSRFEDRVFQELDGIKKRLDRLLENKST